MLLRTSAAGRVRAAPLRNRPFQFGALTPPLDRDIICNSTSEAESSFLGRKTEVGSGRKLFLHFLTGSVIMFLRLGFALFLAWCSIAVDAAAADKPTIMAELIQTQQQMQELKHATASQQETLRIAIESNDKRLADFGALATMQGSHTSWVATLVAMASVLITVIVAGISIVGYYTVTAKAEKSAREAAKDWFNKEGVEHRETITTLTREVDAARANVALMLIELREHAQTTKSAITKSGTDIAELVDSLSVKGQLSGNSDVAAAVQQASTELKRKPENAFTANDYFVRGVALLDSGILQSALNSFELALALSDDTSSGEKPNFLFAKGIGLGRLERYDEAITVYDEIDRLYGNDQAPALRLLVARSLFNKAFILDQIGRSGDSIRVYDDIGIRYGEDDAPGLREQVSKGMNNKGIMLDAIGQHEQAISIYEHIESRYGHDISLGPREQVARQLNNKGVALVHLGRHADAVGAFSEIERRYGQETELGIREQVAKGMINKGGSLGQLALYEDAISIYEETVRIFDHEKARVFRDHVGSALNGSGFSRILLSKLHWKDETRRKELLVAAISVLKRAEVEGKNKERALILGNLGYAQFLCDQRDEAIVATRACLEEGGRLALEAQRVDANLYRLEPEDSEYEQLLIELCPPDILSA
jgi:tetratricopeptide (TPR) repeat protein